MLYKLIARGKVQVSDPKECLIIDADTVFSKSLTFKFLQIKEKVNILQRKTTSHFRDGSVS